MHERKTCDSQWITWYDHRSCVQDIKTRKLFSVTLYAHFLSHLSCLLVNVRHQVTPTPSRRVKLYICIMTFSEFLAFVLVNKKHHSLPGCGTIYVRVLWQILLYQYFGNPAGDFRVEECYNLKV